MIRGIDHLVIACADPDAAAAQLESTAGIVSTGGGRHDAFGTWNRLAFLADGSYLELIGVIDRDLASRSPVGAAALRALDEHGGGLATWAALVGDVEAAVEALAEGGYGRPSHGTRRRDDGERVEWWTAFPDGPLTPERPFLIQHAMTGAEWGPAALEARARFVHPVGSRVGLRRLTLAVDHPAAVATGLRRALGVEGHAVADLAVLRLGPHELRLVPRRELAAPAAVTLSADLQTPVSVQVLNVVVGLERGEVRAVQNASPSPADR
jgi:hypothetical protein